MTAHIMDTFPSQNRAMKRQVFVEFLVSPLLVGLSVDMASTGIGLRCTTFVLIFGKEKEPSSQAMCAQMTSKTFT